MIEFSREDIEAMARAVSLEIPQADVENVRLRLSALLTEMEAIERELGVEMDKVDPVPPVFEKLD